MPCVVVIAIASLRSFLSEHAANGFAQPAFGSGELPHQIANLAIASEIL